MMTTIDLTQARAHAAGHRVGRGPGRELIARTIEQLADEVERLQAQAQKTNLHHPHHHHTMNTQDPITLSNLPALGAPLAGGLFAGLTTTKAGQHAAVVMLPAKPDKPLNWADATAWAESVGGQLPTRPVAALLYANVKSQLQPKWHWTSDTLDADTGDSDHASSAWNCNFGYGYQSGSRKSFGGSAVAVRLIPLSA